MKDASKAFFFAKKKQKTFGPLSRGGGQVFGAFRCGVFAAMLVLAICSFRYPGFDPKNYGGPASWVAYCVVQLLDPATDKQDRSRWLKHTSGYVVAALGLVSAAATWALGVTAADKIEINLLSIAASTLVFLTARRGKAAVTQPIGNDGKGFAK